MTPVDYILGYFLDLAFGDPEVIPHPVRGIGKLVDFLYAKFKKDRSDRFLAILSGVIIWLITVASTGFAVSLLLALSRLIGESAAHLVTIYLIYSVLATRSLHVESSRVFEALKSGDIDKARAALSKIVSRDTKDLSEESILKALLETVSENIVDGIASPLFYLILGGPVIAWMYKAANTLDSMLGYKNREYIYTGKFSARADDALNYVPARVAGLFMLFSSFLLKMEWKRGWKTWLRDAGKHASPNAGIPEAVLAGTLGIQLGGIGSYFGKIVEKPTLGDPENQLKLEHYQEAIKLLYLTSFMLFFAGLAFIMV